MVCQKLMLQSGAVLVAENRSVLSPNLAKGLTLDPFQQPVLAVIHKKEKILENFLNIIVECVLERGAPVLHSEFVHLKRP